MNYLFYSNDDLPKKQLTIEQIKSSFLLVIKSPRRVIFKDTQLNQEWTADNLQEVLEALGIKIESNAPVKKVEKKTNNLKNSIEIGGSIHNSNIVNGSNNTITNNCNGVSYITTGDNLTVGPK